MHTGGHAQYSTLRGHTQPAHSEGVLRQTPVYACSWATYEHGDIPSDQPVVKTLMPAYHWRAGFKPWECYHTSLLAGPHRMLCFSAQMPNAVLSCTHIPLARNCKGYVCATHIARLHQ